MSLRRAVVSSCRRVAVRRSPWGRRSLTRSLNDIAQRPYPIDRDQYFIPLREREIVGWDDAGAGEQDAAVRETGLAVQELDERVQVALHLGQRGRAGESRPRTSTDLELDPRGRRDPFRLDENRRAERARAVVRLGLREIER